MPISTNTRHHWQFSVWSLMAAPVAWALLLSSLALRNRFSAVDRWEREYHWCCDPRSEFWPVEGTRVAKGDELFKVARTGMEPGGRYRLSCWVTRDGMIHDQYCSPYDRG